MEDYETVAKNGKVERRIYIDSGKFAIYGYESEGKISNKFRVVMDGREKRSYFLIDTGKARNLAIKADFEDNITVLKDGKSVKVADLLH